MSKEKQSMDQSQAQNALIRACDGSMLCFDLLCFALDTLTHFVINYEQTVRVPGANGTRREAPPQSTKDSSRSVRPHSMHATSHKSLSLFGGGGFFPGGFFAETGGTFAETRGFFAAEAGGFLAEAGPAPVDVRAAPVAAPAIAPVPTAATAAAIPAHPPARAAAPDLAPTTTPDLDSAAAAATAAAAT